MATLATRLNDLAIAIATDVKQLRTWLTGSSSGNLTGLATTDKSNIVNAINEVRTTAVNNAVPAATTTVAGKAELATDAEALAYSATGVVLTPSNLAAIRGVANGVATLDGSGLVPSSQLPAYVDDVVDFANLAAFPPSGTTGKIYIAVDTLLQYRWSGSAYVNLPSSPGSSDSVPEGSLNLYFTNLRADARAEARITALVGNTDSDLAAAYAAAKA